MNNKFKTQWLDSPFVSNEEKEIIKKYSDEELKTYFAEKQMKFGTAGIRAVMGPGTNLLNKFTYRQLAEGYAKFLLSKNEHPKVIIAHDNRRNNHVFTNECARVLTSFGIEVNLFEEDEMLATPIVSYLIRNLELDGGIIVTASHNPKEYNGFKVYNKTGGQVLPDEANLIESFFPANEGLLEPKYEINHNLIKYIPRTKVIDYYEAAKSCLIKTDVIADKKFPVIFTAHHGTASKTLPKFLEIIGYSNIIPVIEQCFEDCDFKNSDCSNPEEKKSFELALEYAQKHDAKIMLGVDPDADRLAVVIKDKKGEWVYLTGNEMGIIFTYYVFNNKETIKDKFVVSTFVSTSLIDRIAKHFNAEVIRTATGFKWLANEVEKNYEQKEFIVAFEEAIGSLNSTINRDKDSFQAAALALEIFNYYDEKGMTLIELLENEIYPMYGYWKGTTVSNTINSLDWKDQANKILDYFKSYKEPLNEDIKLIKNNWNEQGQCVELFFEKEITVRLRVSGTEPKYKFYYDVYGETLEDSKKKFEMVKKAIEKIADRAKN